MAQKQDLIEFEEETERPKIVIGGIVGALAGALIGYKWAQQKKLEPTPVSPLPDGVIITDEQGHDLIDYTLKMGLLAAAGYALGSFFSKASPRRFMLRHKD